jgi:drug/metabolite transporter (DMT)-like permease
MNQNLADARPASSLTGITAISLSAMLALAIMWGLSIPATKLALLTLPPLTLTALRFLFAVPLFLLLAVGRLRVPWRAVPSIVALGVMGISLGNVAQSFGVAGTSASVSTIISATIPVFVVIFAALRLKQPVTPRQWSGLLAAFAGIALVAFGSGSEATDESRTTLTGVAWMLVSAVAIAFYFIWSAELSEKYGTMAVAAWNGLAGLIAILPLAGWEMAHTTFQFTAQVIWLTLYLAVMVTVLGLLLWLYLLRNIPARVAASVQYLQPIIGIASSAVLFGDKLGLLFFAGVVLIFGGLALTVARSR